MTTIDAGENVKLVFSNKTSLGVIIPTSEIASFSVTLVYQPCGCGGPDEDGSVLGTWTFTSPDTYSAGMQSGGDGIFEIEVLTSQTTVPGILSAVTTVSYFNAEFFVSGSETTVTVTEDVLEILAVPSLVAVSGTPGAGVDNYLTPTGGNYFQPDGESLYLVA